MVRGDKRGGRYLGHSGFKGNRDLARQKNASDDRTMAVTCTE